MHIFILELVFSFHPVSLTNYVDSMTCVCVGIIHCTWYRLIASIRFCSLIATVWPKTAVLLIYSGTLLFSCITNATLKGIIGKAIYNLISSKPTQY